MLSALPSNWTGVMTWCRVPRLVWTDFASIRPLLRLCPALSCRIHVSSARVHMPPFGICAYIRKKLTLKTCLRTGIEVRLLRRMCDSMLLTVCRLAPIALRSSRTGKTYICTRCNHDAECWLSSYLIPPLNLPLLAATRPFVRNLDLIALIRKQGLQPLRGQTDVLQELRQHCCLCRQWFAGLGSTVRLKCFMPLLSQEALEEG